MNGEAVFPQGSKQGEPVMAGGLHTDDKIFGCGGDGAHHGEQSHETGVIVAETEGFTDNVSGIIDDHSFVASLCNIDSYDVHEGGVPFRID